jgi:transcriptional regulator with XRE-family HTH domain
VTPLIDVIKLRTAAAQLGDHSDYLIAKRTGVPASSISRIVNGQGDPKISALQRLGAPYGLSLKYVQAAA